jgi:hypothetical protein
MEATVSKYILWCNQHEIRPFYNHESISGFLIAHVQRNNGSTRSLDLLISYLKRYVLWKGLLWLNRNEEYKLKLIVNELKYKDIRGVQRKEPLKLVHLLKIMNKIDLSKDQELLGMTLMFLGHDGLMRIGELCSGLTTDDIEWEANKKSFSLRLHRSKCNRKDGSEYITFADRDGWCAVKMLEKFYNRHKLWDKHNTIVFQQYKSKTDSLSIKTKTKLVSKDWLRKYIKRCVLLIGLNPKIFSGHSLRAGGATDLFIANVPYPIIKKFGRWKTDCALIYYRDNDNLGMVIANAFQMVSKTYWCSGTN